MIPRTLFLSVAALLTTCLAQSIEDPTCLFNATHCACQENAVAGNCLRKVSGTDVDGTCTVSTCNAGGYACDCLGTSICSRDTCSIWVTKDGTPASRLEKGATVACAQKTDATCLNRLEIPEEYKMVRFGPGSLYNTAGTMFNMSAFSDVDDEIVGRYRMSDKWDHHDTLRYRHITMRLYNSPTSGEHMLCTVYNTYGTMSDGLGPMSVTATIKGESGQELQFVACDDKNECMKKSSTTLTATHNLIFTHSDGWCVKPVENGIGPVSVKFSDVNGFEGISFQLSDGSEDSYTFFKGEGFGMTGSVDNNGLVTNGNVPDILIDLAGIKVPQGVTA